MQALRDGTNPKDLSGLPKEALLKSVSHEPQWHAAIDSFLMP